MINKKEVEHIAELARLGLEEDEIKMMDKELSSILDYFQSLEKAKVEDVEPTSHSVSMENITREDIGEKQSLEKVNQLLEAAPEREGRYIKVKNVL